MNIRLTQIDGKLPNLALMKLSAWHLARGDSVHLTRAVRRDMFEPPYDLVYGSAIFSFSAARLAAFREQWPDAEIGGTGTDTYRTVEELIGTDFEKYDYSIYPDFAPSLGFTQRGCRLKCKFCVVPKKEGKPRSVNTIADIWRGDGHPKKLILLDNDFFGQVGWRDRIAEVKAGGFKICINQGINVRLIDDEAAAALASVEYRDDQFQERRLYTAWDNLKDEGVFFRGIDTLERSGIPAKHVMAYMLIGYAPDETFERIKYRFDRMVERGIMPYPMVYDPKRVDLKRFQRWALTGLYRAVPWEEYLGSRTRESVARAKDAVMFAQIIADEQKPIPA